MVSVEHDHLRGAPGRAARFNSTRRAIEDFEERHQTARCAAAGQLLAFATEPREVRTRTRAAFEDARFAKQPVEDPALIDEIVFDGKDIARGNLRVFEGAGRTHRLVRLRIDVIVTLRRARNSVRPMQTGVKPLRRIWCADLAREHRRHLVVVNARIVFGIEVAVLPPPVRPAAREPIEDLA
jgi:hypothetical protein